MNEIIRRPLVWIIVMIATPIVYLCSLSNTNYGPKWSKEELKALRKLCKR